MKKQIFLSILALIVLLSITGCNTDEQETDNEDALAMAQGEEQATTTTDKPWCNWIEESDVVIRLDLPEAYQESSYTAGFLHLHGGSGTEIYHNGRLARQNCDYRVGFSKEDFENVRGMLIPYAKTDDNQFFTYEGEPLELELKNGLPDVKGEIVLHIDGTTPAAGYETYTLLKNQA